jgi:hypothetical protein
MPIRKLYLELLSEFENSDFFSENPEIFFLNRAKIMFKSVRVLVDLYICIFTFIIFEIRLQTPEKI